MCAASRGQGTAREMDDTVSRLHADWSAAKALGRLLCEFKRPALVDAWPAETPNSISVFCAQRSADNDDSRGGFVYQYDITSR